MNFLWCLLRPGLKPLLLAFLFSLLSSLSSIGLMAAAAFLITTAALQPPLYTLSLAITAVRFCGLSRAVFRYLDRYLSHDVTFRLLTGLRGFIYSSLEKIVPVKLPPGNIGMFLNRLTEDMDTLKDFYLNAIAPLFLAVLISVFTALLFSFYSLGASLILLGAFSLCLCCCWYGASQSFAAADELQAVYKNECLDFFLGLEALKTSAYGPLKIARLATIDEENVRQRWQREKNTATMDQLASFISLTALLGILAVLIEQITSGSLTPATAGVLLLASQAALEVLLPLPEACRTLSAAKATAENLLQLNQIPVNSSCDAERLKNPSPLLCCKGIYFSYDGQNQIFSKLCFSIQPGEKVAIIGPSGSGKSTLFNLLLCLWTAQKGSLYLNGVPYCQLTPEKIRQSLRAITQQTYVFSDTIAENFRRLYPAVSDDAIWDALKKAQLADFVANLPHKLATQTGENGSLFSGGQRQRLAIARALIEPTELLLLDEPTSGLDNISAHAFMQTFTASFPGQTLLLITHDHSLLQYVDRVLILKNGALESVPPDQHLV